MRILFATYALAFQNPGGGEQVLLALKRELEALGHQVDLFDPWDHDPVSYDLIHYFSRLDNAFWRHAKRLAPRVPLLVTPTLYAPESWKSKLRNRLASWSGVGEDQGALFALPDLWLPATRAEAEILKGSWNIPDARIHVLPNGVDERFFAADPTLFRSRTGIEGSFVLNVARFHPVKNHLALIEAADRIGARLVLIGNPDIDQRAYFEACQESARKSRAKVDFMPAIAHEDPLLASAYAAASVFSLPSRFETFGIAALEAAAAGAPLVLTRKLRSLEVFAPMARLVDPEDPGALARALEEALAEGRDSAATASRRKAANKYLWSGIARELEGLYRSLGRSTTRAGLPTASP